jgi:hypothetical protein
MIEPIRKARLSYVWQVTSGAWIVIVRILRAPRRNDVSGVRIPEPVTKIVPVKDAAWTIDRTTAVQTVAMDPACELMSASDRELMAAVETAHHVVAVKPTDVGSAEIMAAVKPTQVGRAEMATVKPTQVGSADLMAGVEPADVGTAKPTQVGTANVTAGETADVTAGETADVTAAETPTSVGGERGRCQREAKRHRGG